MFHVCRQMAMEAAGAGAAAVMRKNPSTVMPTEEVKTAVDQILIEHGFEPSIVKEFRREEDLAHFGQLSHTGAMQAMDQPQGKDNPRRIA
jgi:hypothetical protein